MGLTGGNGRGSTIFRTSKRAHHLSGRIFAERLLLFFVAASLSGSQDTRGTVAGRITYPSGAVIAGASVLVANPGTGTKVTVTSGTEGLYQASFLSPGMYNVEVTAAGF